VDDKRIKFARRAVRVSGMCGTASPSPGGLNSDERVFATAGAFLQEGELVRPVSKRFERLMKTFPLGVRHPIPRSSSSW